MTWFDLVALLFAAIIIIFEARQEAGRGLLDTIATLVAVHLTRHWSPLLSDLLRWPPLPGTDASPWAYALCFGILWSAALLVSRWLHRQTRWTMDTYDAAIGAAFGLLIAATAGHVVVESIARVTMASIGELPDCLRNSCFAEELRSFRTYHTVMNILENTRYHR
jgi:hypothetical protein